MIDYGIKTLAFLDEYASLRRFSSGSSTQYLCGDLGWVDFPTNLSIEGHTHSADDIVGGYIDISLLPVGLTSTTVALGDHTHDYLSLGGGELSGDLISRNIIPLLSNRYSLGSYRNRWKELYAYSIYGDLVGTSSYSLYTEYSDTSSYADDLSDGIILGIDKGGTGIGSYIKGDILYGDIDGSLTKLNIGDQDNILVVNDELLPVWKSFGDLGISAEDHNHDDKYLKLTGGALSGSIYPSTSRINLGSTNSKWEYIYADTFSGSLIGNVTGTASTATTIFNNDWDNNKIPFFVSGEMTVNDDITIYSFAPTNHASNTTDYGIAALNTYGHVKPSYEIPLENKGLGSPGTTPDTFAMSDHTHPAVVSVLQAERFTTGRLIGIGGAITVPAESFNGETNLILNATHINANYLEGMVPFETLPVGIGSNEIAVGNHTHDYLSIYGGMLSGSLLPATNNLNLGSSNNKWDNIYANIFSGSLTGTASRAITSSYATNAEHSSTATDAENASSSINADTASRIGSSMIGSNVNPIYVNNGIVTAITSTIGNENRPIFLDSGSFSLCDVNLHVTASNAITASFATNSKYTSMIGTSDIGTANHPVYISSGVVTVCDVDLYVTASKAISASYATIADHSFTSTNASSSINADTASRIGDVMLGTPNLPVYVTPTGIVTACMTTLYVTASKAITSSYAYNSEHSFTATDAESASSSLNAISAEYALTSMNAEYASSSLNSTNAEYASSSLNSTNAEYAINAETASRIGSTIIGSPNLPVYVNSNGIVTACDTTLYITSSKAITASYATYAETANKVGSASIGSGINPIYLNNGELKASTESAGTINLPIYLNSGIIEQCSNNLYITASYADDLSPNKILDITKGGTGISTYTSGSMLYASGSTYQKLEIGNTNNILIVSGSVPTWSSLSNAGISTEGHTHDYLPLTGGEIKGNITLNKDNAYNMGTTHKRWGIVYANIFSGSLNGTATFADDLSDGSILSVTKGGTGMGTYAPGELIYAIDSTKLGRLTMGHDKTILTSSGSALTWFSLDQLGIATANHTHNYLPLQGGTLSGSIRLKENGVYDMGTINTKWNIIHANTFSGNLIGTASYAISASYTTNAKYASMIGTNDIGTINHPVYVASGVITPCDVNLYVTASKAITASYASNADHASSAIDSINALTASKVGTTSIGSNTIPIYVNNGTVTESNASIGSANLPMYLNSGKFTVCNTSLNVTASYANDLSVNKILSVNKGGTGFNSYNKGDILYGDIDGGLTKLNIGNPNTILSVSDNNMLSWEPIESFSEITDGFLPLDGGVLTGPLSVNITENKSYFEGLTSYDDGNGNNRIFLISTGWDFNDLQFALPEDKIGISVIIRGYRQDLPEKTVYINVGLRQTNAYTFEATGWKNSGLYKPEIVKFGVYNDATPQIYIEFPNDGNNKNIFLRVDIISNGLSARKEQITGGYLTNLKTFNNWNVSTINENNPAPSWVNISSPINEVVLDDTEYLPLTGGTLSGNISLNNDIEYNLGSLDNKWKNIYANTFTGNLTGTAQYADDLSVGSILNTNKGGTGFDTYNKGDIIYASDINTLSKLPINTNLTDSVLTVNDGLPSWLSLNDANIAEKNHSHTIIDLMSGNNAEQGLFLTSGNTPEENPSWINIKQTTVIEINTLSTDINIPTELIHIKGNNSNYFLSDSALHDDTIYYAKLPNMSNVNSGDCIEISLTRLSGTYHMYVIFDAKNNNNIFKLSNGTTISGDTKRIRINLGETLHLTALYQGGSGLNWRVRRFADIEV